MADPIDQKTLTAELAAARGQMAGYLTALRHDLDVSARLKSGVSGNPAAWFAGAAIVGLLLSRIPPTRRKVVVKGPAMRSGGAEKAGRAAFLLGALKIGLDFAKPALLSWVKSRFFSGAPAAQSPRR